MKKETLEEAIERLYPINIIYGGDNNAVSRSIFVEGVKWEQEQNKKMYSEEEVLKFTQTMIMQYKFGNTNIEQMDLLKETLEQFKNK
jgi:hypothetical protein